MSASRPTSTPGRPWPTSTCRGIQASPSREIAIKVRPDIRFHCGIMEHIWYWTASFFSTLKSDDKAQMNRQYSSSFIVWMLIDGLNVSMAVDYEDYDTPRMGGGGGGVPAGGYTGAVIGVMTFVIVALIGAVVTMSLADWRRSHRPAADLHADVRKVVRHRTLRLPTPRQSHSRCWTRRCCLERRKPTGGTAPTSATRCRRAASRCTPRWPRRLAAAPPVPSRTTTATRPSSRPSTSNPSRSPRRRRSAPPAWVPKKNKMDGPFFCASASCAALRRLIVDFN